MKLTAAGLDDMDASKFNLEELGIKTIAVDSTSPEMKMPKTADSIEKFIIEHKVLEKIKLLLDIRQNMEM